MTDEVTYYLPKGYKLELEFSSGHFVNWKVTDIDRNDIWVKSEDIDLVNSKEGFARQLESLKQEVLGWATSMEGNFSQIDADF